MIKSFYTEVQDSIFLAYDFTKKDYESLSEHLGFREQKLKDTINEEIFTPRLTRSDWDIYKIYYPQINYDKVQNKFTSCELIPIIVFRNEKQIFILENKQILGIEIFIRSFLEITEKNIENKNFLLSLFHHIAEQLYKNVRFLITEHDKVEKILRNSKNNDKLISLAEIEQGFGVFSLALRNLEFLLEYIEEDEEFVEYEDFTQRILQELNYTSELATTYVEICKTTRETYASYISNDMNVTMKFLAAATILITIPNMIFGFYGMNVRLPLQGRGEYSALSIIASFTIILTFAIWRYLKRKKMI